MPELDGVETLKQIKSNPNYNNIKIIDLATHALTGDDTKFIAMGFDAYISKPISILLKRIKILI